MADAALPPAAGNTVWPKIYIYQLPKHFVNCSLDPRFLQGIYAAEQLVPAAIRNSPYVTADPQIADLFLVDVWLYCRDSAARPDAAELGR